MRGAGTCSIGTDFAMYRDRNTNRNGTHLAALRRKTARLGKSKRPGPPEK